MKNQNWVLTWDLHNAKSPITYKMGLLINALKTLLWVVSFTSIVKEVLTRYGLKHIFCGYYWSVSTDFVLTALQKQQSLYSNALKKVVPIRNTS
jgi:hypothetical protein